MLFFKIGKLAQAQVFFDEEYKLGSGVCTRAFFLCEKCKVLRVLIVDAL